MAQLIINKKGNFTEFYRNSPYDISKNDFTVREDRNIYYVTNNTGMYMSLDTRAVGMGNVEYIIRDGNRYVFGFYDKSGNKIPSSFVFYARFGSNSTNGSDINDITSNDGTNDGSFSKKGNSKHLNRKKEFKIEQLFPHRN